MFNAYSDKTSVWLYLFLPHLFKQKQMTKIQTIPYVVVWFCAIRLFVLSLGYHTQFMPVSIALHIRKMTAEKLRFVRKKRKKKRMTKTIMQLTDWLTDWMYARETQGQCEYHLIWNVVSVRTIYFWLLLLLLLQKWTVAGEKKFLDRMCPKY